MPWRSLQLMLPLQQVSWLPTLSSSQCSATSFLSEVPVKGTWQGPYRLCRIKPPGHLVRFHQALLLQCGCMSIRQLVFYHTVLTMHRILKSGRPLFLKNRLSSDFPYLRHPFDTVVEGSFKGRGTKAYNSIPVLTVSRVPQAFLCSKRSWRHGH